MAQEIVGVKVKVDGSEVGASVGSLKKQLREAQTEVATLSDKFGATSIAAIDAAKRAAELKDRIGDAKDLVAAFNPDAKFKAFGQSIAGVASGFTAVQGAMGLMGSESKELEKTLIKVQSAMALSEGLNGIMGSIDAFKNMSAVIKDGVVKAFGTLKSAIISTGIGALVIGLGLLVANFDAVKKYVLNLVPGLAKVGDFIGKIVNKITDFVGVTSEAGRATAKLIKENEAAIKSTERFLDLNGDKYDEYTQRKIKANVEFLKKQNQFKNDETLSEIQKNEFIKQAREKANREILKSDEDRNEKQKGIRDADTKKRIEEEEKEKQTRLAEEKKLEEGREASRQAGFKFEMLALNNKEKAAQKAADDAKKQADDEDAQMEKNRQRDEADAQQLIDISNRKIIESDRLAAVDKKNADLKKTHQQAQFDLALQTLNTLGGLVDKDSIAGKSIAVATAIMNTYQGATKALAQGGTFGPIAAAATIAAGMINVKKIISTKIPSAKGGGDVGGGVGASISSAAAPMSPSAPIQNTLTQLNQGSINQLGSATSRAYVVESDVTSGQEKIRRLNRAARLG